MYHKHKFWERSTLESTCHRGILSRTLAPSHSTLFLEWPFWNHSHPSTPNTKPHKHHIYLHRPVCQDQSKNQFQRSRTASSAMNISRVLSIAARRAPVARCVANVSHRGFAVASCQQLHNARNESATSPRVGALLASAVASMGVSVVLGNDRSDCCGIAGVVGGSGDAR